MEALDVKKNNNKQTNTLHNLIKQQDDDNYSVIDKNMLRIQMKKNINILLKIEKTVVLNDWKIQRLFFFYLGFLSQPFTDHRTIGEGGGNLRNSKGSY